jgi:hypothetical protein
VLTLHHSSIPLVHYVSAVIQCSTSSLPSSGIKPLPFIVFVIAASSSLTKYTKLYLASPASLSYNATTQCGFNLKMPLLNVTVVSPRLAIVWPDIGRM